MDSFQFKDDCREVVSGARMLELLSPFPSLRETSQSVHAISLRNKSYTLEAAEVLAEYLANLSDVRRADLADMIAGRPEEEALKVLSKISTALQGHQLQELDLSDNALGEKGVRACFPILQNQNQLEKMFFCNNGLSAAAAECIVDEVLLFRGLDAPTSLKVFHFYNNMSGDGGAVALGKLLLLSPRLEDLRFSATRAQRAGALAFAKQLACLRELIYLDLSDNTFAEEGGQAIAAALKHQRNLRKLNLRDASLGDIGMIAICKALVSSMATTTLEVFDISGNDLTAECMPFVARVVERNPNLRHLMLEENEIGSKGIKILARTISKKSTCSCKLLEVFVSNFNEITSSGAVSIIDALKSVRTLKKIQIDGNNISAEAIEKIKDILETNNMGEVLATFEDNDEDDDEDDDNETDDDEDKEQMDVIENTDSSEDVDGLISSIENIHIERICGQ